LVSPWPTLSLTLIHPSAQNGLSANFAVTEFLEVRIAPILYGRRLEGRTEALGVGRSSATECREGVQLVYGRRRRYLRLVARLSEALDVTEVAHREARRFLDCL
jgi:hypothetical protein